VNFRLLMIGTPIRSVTFGHYIQNFLPELFNCGAAIPKTNVFDLCPARSPFVCGRRQNLLQ
jgi:hypothetical protein